MLNDFKKRMNDEKKYGEARKVLEKMEEIKKNELERQKAYINFKQREELRNMETAQRENFNTFRQSWDDYIRKYEENSDDTIKKIKVYFFYIVLRIQDKEFFFFFRKNIFMNCEIIRNLWNLNTTQDHSKVLNTFMT